jgi:BirA family biotin operon repressor/biotin-[acetyl-CoA-carboxylase] ligase
MDFSEPSYEEYDVLTSTNEKALERLLQGCNERTVVVAKKQVAGRGQQGTTWESEAGANLTMSIALRPRFLRAEHAFLLSMAAAMGVTYYLRRRHINAKIKWPNDIYVGERKICGILIEQSIKSEFLSQSVIGIGLNVNQQSFEQLPNATSMRLQLGSNRSLSLWCVTKGVTRLTLTFYDMLQRCYPKVAVSPARQARNIAAFTRYYYLHLYRSEGFHLFRAGDETFMARIVSVMPSGEISLQTEDGMRHNFWFKEVEFVPLE